MKKIKHLLILMISITLIISSCGKDEEAPAPVVTPTTNNNGGGGGGNISYPSPCTSTLTNNQAVCTPNVFPGLTTLSLNSVLSNDLQQVNCSVVASYPLGGDMDVKLGNVIAAGTYGLEQSPFPTAGKALLTFIPLNGNNFLSTSGTLYISETSTQWILEWCAINCNSTSTSTSCTGKTVVNK